VVVPPPPEEGGGGNAVTVRVKACVASGLTPLAAVTVKMKVPAVVGVPDRTPAGDRVTPEGRAPATVKVGAGVPVAMIWKLPFEPSRKVVEAAETIDGAFGVLPPVPQTSPVGQFETAAPGAWTVRVASWATVPTELIAVKAGWYVPSFAEVTVPASVAVPFAPGVKMRPVGKLEAVAVRLGTG
jgi:hypothetical protein